MKEGIRIIEQELEALKASGVYSEERVLTVPQGSRIDTSDKKDVVNMCANNYLGLSNHQELLQAARDSYDQWGYGLSSVRFICGTQVLHKELEARLAEFFGFEDAILYSSCFDANGGLFETILTEADAVISDRLNHASIIDGIRLSKARRYVYDNNDMRQLEARLKEADGAGARIKLIATDGVFSMDGIIADLKTICDLADTYGALVMVDDSHASGFVGRTGRGTPEHCEVKGRIDIMTSTLGKAMGGASGGFTMAKKPVIDWLRQKSRPYLFSNTLAPAIAATSLKVLELLQRDSLLIDRLNDNTLYFRQGAERIGLDVIPGTHPIVPVMIYDAVKSIEVADYLLELGLYVIAFKFPVVPQGKARIRTQVSAAHSREDLDFALDCFARAKAKFDL
ncbi:MAG TPA: glycine C-acetyltransferase [Bacillota bacterium]|jgi:glycine C-acetyltransferase|nr:glycine C-acetyltransferase [Fastidiosipila sp.]HPX93854.1 glycine C-acetyltransferase [Bacillota bacterium]HQB81719.1 glycine C-acetyltransferase [Bacillota bacterium]